LPGITAEPLQSLSAQADLYFNACGKIQFHKRVNSFFCWLDNVDQALVRANFVLVARILIYVWRDQYSVLFLPGRQRDWTPDLRTCAPSRFYNFLCGRVDQLVIKRLEANPDALVFAWNRNSAISTKTPG